MTNPATHQPIKIKQALMDAIANAERLAVENPTARAVVYSQGVDDKVKYLARLDSDEAPDGAEVVVSLSRTRPEGRPDSWTLRDATRHMVQNMPLGIELFNYALAEHYPKPHDLRVFAYQFFSAEGRNVGTWIPDVSLSGVTFINGFDGRGRIYSNGIVDGKMVGPKHSIKAWIDADLVREEPSKVDDPEYLVGWRKAEEGLRRDDLFACLNSDSEMRNRGFSERHALEEARRLEREMRVVSQLQATFASAPEKQLAPQP